MIQAGGNAAGKRFLGSMSFIRVLTDAGGRQGKMAVRES